MPTKVGSSSSTAMRVAGSVKLKASTPRKPRKSGTGADATRRGRALRDAIEAAHDRGGVADEGAGIEDGVEVELRRGLRHQLPELDALVPGALGGLLDDPVGVVARAAGLHERQQRALGVERAVRCVQVPAHPL